jgi:signal peptidase I
MKDPAVSWRAVLEIAQALALAVVISVVLNLFVVQVTEVRQRSMEMTLEQDDRVLVSKLDYRFGQPHAGDIVVFDPPGPRSAIPFVKRVIGVGGDTIDVRDGDVFVNGNPVEIPQARGRTLPLGTVAFPFLVPEGQVFVLGDNRQLSSDSRSFGPVPVRNIVGKVVMRFWPATRIVFFDW